MKKIPAVTSGRPAIAIITILRGVAALMVFLFHIINLSHHYIENSYLRAIFYFGQFGVQVFFVISGFVIAYSLIGAGYQTRDYFTFLKKRVIRIEPPYLVVLLLTIIFLILRAKTGLANGKQELPDWRQVALHVGYLIPFSNFAWLSIVFWTLAIEFQFYLLFSLLVNFFVRNKLSRWIISAILLIIFFKSDSQAAFFYWSPVFLLGINLALYKKKKISAIELWIVALLYSAVIFYKLGVNVFAFASVPFVIIYFEPAIKSGILMFFGKISYSLYLLHTLIGFFIINLGIRFTKHFYQKIIFVSLALGITILASYLLYYFVERPCQKIASSIKYKHEQDPRGQSFWKLVWK